MSQSRKIKQIRVCLGLLQDVLLRSYLPFVELMLILAESAEGGREIAKKTAHVSRIIIKIVDCIRIAFGLPYNYKPNLSLKII